MCVCVCEVCVCVVCVRCVCVCVSVCVCVCVCVAKFGDPTTFMKLNLESFTRHALLRLQPRLHKRLFATVTICSKVCN